MDPEQNFGIMAYDSDRTTTKNASKYWKSKGTPGAGTQGITGIKVNYDEGFTYLEIALNGLLAGELEPGSGSDLELDVGIDTIGRKNGTVNLPVEGLPDLPGGVEFLLRINAKDGALLLARPDYNRGDTRFMAAPAADPQFVHIQLLVNRVQVNSIDGTLFPGQYTDDSVLRHGVFDPASKAYYSLGNWYVSSDGTRVFVRLPWLLLNVSDPSSLRVIHDDRTDLPQGPAAVRTQLGENALHTEKTNGFSFYAVTTRGGKLLDFQPRQGNSWAKAKKYIWPGWDTPTYHERLKQSYPEIKALFGATGD
jgi:hypothetical protein